MPGILGHTDGIKKNLLHRLEKLYQRRIRGWHILEYELSEELCDLSLALKREVTLLFDFQGRVELVIVGEIEQLDQVSHIALPQSTDGLAKRYCITTHLKWKPVSLGDQVTLLQFHFPLMVILMAGLAPKIPGGFSRQFGENPHFCDGAQILHPLAHRQEDGSFQRICEVMEPMTARKATEELLETWIEWAEPVFQERQRPRNQQGERALLMGLHTGGQAAEESLLESMSELKQLAKSAGAIVVDQMIQSRRHPEPGTYIGSGKAEELALQLQQLDIDVVIADDELSPVQQRNLERILRVKVIDRTELILDIFAQRAQSREGKIQVELAQLQYELPRLKGRGRTFSQQTAVGAKGGIATRGPGETKLETDRRLLRERVTVLEREASEVVKHRQFQRQTRKRSSTPLIALIGYTNAGKSTLMRRLTQADVLIEDRLFATLDPTIRKLYLGAPAGDTDGMGVDVLLSDTVGFIRKLPTFLIKAFRGTLEEAASADLLWHVWDVSHPESRSQAESVHEVLETLWEELDIPPPPLWTLCNKIDRLETESATRSSSGFEGESIRTDVNADMTGPLYRISAKTGEGIPELLQAARAFFQEQHRLQWEPPSEASSAASGETLQSSLRESL